MMQVGKRVGMPVDFGDLEERTRAAIQKAIEGVLTQTERAALRLASRLLKREVAPPTNREEALALHMELRAAGFELVTEVAEVSQASMWGAPYRVVAYRLVEADAESVPSGFVLTNDRPMNGPQA